MTAVHCSHAQMTPSIAQTLRRRRRTALRHVAENHMKVPWMIASGRDGGLEAPDNASSFLLIRFRAVLRTAKRQHDAPRLSAGRRSTSALPRLALCAPG